MSILAHVGALKPLKCTNTIESGPNLSLEDEEANIGFNYGMSNVLVSFQLSSIQQHYITLNASILWCQMVLFPNLYIVYIVYSSKYIFMSFTSEKLNIDLDVFMMRTMIPD